MKKKNKKYNKFVQIFDPKMWFHDFVKFTGMLPVLIDLRLKRVYLDKKPKGLFKGKYLISANHASFIDPIIIMNAFWSRRVCFVATKQFFIKKFWKIVFRGFGCIEIDKEAPTLKTFNEVGEKLARGHLVSVFPEGHVTNDTELHALKSGIVMMAVMNEAPILPIYIVKREKRIKRQIVMIGEKINPADYMAGVMPSIDEINNISNILLEKEKELKDKYESLKEKKR